MSDQATLFDDLYREPLAPPVVAPAARATDPQSSHDAARRVEVKAKRTRERVIDLVFRFPGRTSKQLSELTDDAELDRHEIARRLPEAERQGEIERRQQGKAECRWWPKGESCDFVDDV